ncbi:hypothetical protein A3F59_02415 [Candidatus Roizmanbacteria bacterium RIFCSPHIGHO2_12_FULL_38_13]|nr:MAG: hypothetical protein A3F59_02415 [Candidatus Roizmanbacteria bacterium RIFCSPHIGHO2_12_FULL_38_13]
MKYRFDHVACGGTFDLQHKGHISLLDRAFNIGKRVSIGLSTESFCKEIGKTPYESQQIRRKNLVVYLKSKHLEERAKITWLNNIYGTTAKDKTLEAIIVSDETVQGADLINKRRIKQKLNKLKVIICPQILAEDGKKISTGRIKSGEISIEGTNYRQFLLKIAGRRFNNQIRMRLKKPFGKIINMHKSVQLTRPLIAVGDVSVRTLLKSGISPDVSIIDFFVNRKRVFANLAQLGFTQPNPDYIIENAPGQISKDLIETVQKVIKNNKSNPIILVNGEEDLAFIPALLLSPIPATIVYGQPDKGLVEASVTIESKNRLCALLGLV